MDFIPRSVHESFQVSSFPFAHGCCYRYTIFTFTFLFLFFSTSSRFSKIFKKIFNLSPAVSLSLVIVTTHALQSILVYYPTVSRCISRNSCRKKYSPYSPDSFSLLSLIFLSSNRGRRRLISTKHPSYRPRNCFLSRALFRLFRYTHIHTYIL